MVTIPFISNGKQVIADVFKAFEDQKKRLQQGIEMCQAEVVKQDVEIAKINDERIQNLDAIDRANKLIVNLNRLTS